MNINRVGTSNYEAMAAYRTNGQQNAQRATPPASSPVEMTRPAPPTGDRVEISTAGQTLRTDAAPASAPPPPPPPPENATYNASGQIGG